MQFSRSRFLSMHHPLSTLTSSSCVLGCVHSDPRRYRTCCRNHQQPCLYQISSSPLSLPSLSHTRHVPAFCRVAASAAQSPAGRSIDNQQNSSRNTQQQQWHQLVLESISEPQKLVKLVAKGKINLQPDSMVANVRNQADDSSSAVNPTATAAVSGGMPYKQLTMRPVLVKGKLLLQISLLDSRQDITKNYTPDEAVQQLQQLLLLPWQSASLQTTTATTNIQVSKKGKVLIQSSKVPAAPAAEQSDNSSTIAADAGMEPPQQQQGLNGSWNAAGAAAGPISLQHDRVKAVPINGSIADSFLQKIGLQTAEGRIKANMQAKFTQINEFLKLLIHTGELDSMIQQQQQQQQSEGPSTSSRSSVRILDCGCGSSHLTFGTYHYLNNVRGVPIQLTGIDTNKALMDRSNRHCEDLEISDHARFFTAAIRNYQPQQQPDIVLALHACDTATDESLALGVRSGARIIMSVPCCHKDLHRQQQVRRQRSNSSSSSVDLFDPLLCHGILRQRMLDLLTDTFRAHLLRMMGYRTDVVEFVSGEHTPRNLLVRAVKQQRQLPESEQTRLVEQYIQLKQYWGVVPHLEKLLREDGSIAEGL